MADPGHRQKVLRENAVSSVHLDFWEDDMKVDREYYRPGWQANRFLLSKPSVQLSPTLDGHLDACTDMYQRNLRDGMIALKCALAYDRTIRFAVVPPAEARAAYAAAAATGFAAGLPTPVQDFVFHHLLGLANRDGLPVQIHTGLLEGMRHPLRQSDPLLLDPLFGRYPGIPFDLFHIGYPWFRESLVLAKSHPNVHLDLCWIISSHRRRRVSRCGISRGVRSPRFLRWRRLYPGGRGLGHLLHCTRERARCSRIVWPIGKSRVPRVQDSFVDLPHNARGYSHLARKPLFP
jgi:hypothetical protein